MSTISFAITFEVGLELKSFVPTHKRMVWSFNNGFTQSFVQDVLAHGNDFT